MSVAPNLNLFSFAEPEPAPETRTIEERFRAYHERHPEVLAAFKRFAWEAKRAGRQRFGAKAIAERVRWSFLVERQAGEEFALDNSLVSRYARLLMDEEPELRGIFELRTLRAE